jgi:hypothetical protein
MQRVDRRVKIYGHSMLRLCDRIFNIDRSKPVWNGFFGLEKGKTFDCDKFLLL